MKQTPRPSDPNKPRNLSGVQFRYSAPQKDGFRWHELQAIAPEVKNRNSQTGKGLVVGTLQWHPQTGDVNWVRTHQDYRGLGVATTMWEKAHKLSADTGIKAPKHSKHRTEEGEAWAKQVGGEMPQRSPYELP
jgi:hypothetical protein